MVYVLFVTCILMNILGLLLCLWLLDESEVESEKVGLKLNIQKTKQIAAVFALMP